MRLEIGIGCKRGYLTTGNYYSNGKSIRKVIDLNFGEATYIKVKDGIEVGDSKVVKIETMEQWAKWPVFENRILDS